VGSLLDSNRIWLVGKGVGRNVIGALVGISEGFNVGPTLGLLEGFEVGGVEGLSVGDLVKEVGMIEIVGVTVGDDVTKDV